MTNRSPFGSHEKSVTVSAEGIKKEEDNTIQVYHTFELDDFHREVLLAYAENLEVAENGFFRLGVAVNAYTEKVALILPIQPTLKKRSAPGMNLATRLHIPTSETLNRFFWRRTVRAGKLSSVTRAGWLATSGVQ